MCEARSAPQVGALCILSREASFQGLDSHVFSSVPWCPGSDRDCRSKLDTLKGLAGSPT